MKIGIAVIGTKKKVNTKGFLDVFSDFIENQAKETEKLFVQSTSGFKRHRPTVEQRGTATVNGRGDIEIITGVLRSTPDNTIYAYVNWGTKARVLTAHNPRGMQFQLYYSPATRHGSLSGGTWTKTGPWQVRYTINHPGTGARRFDEFIHKAISDNFDTEARKVILKQRGKFWRT